MLQYQVEKRALEVWETLEKLEEEKELRVSKREKTKTKKFNQQVKSNEIHYCKSIELINYLNIYLSKICGWQCVAVSTRNKRLAMSMFTERNSLTLIEMFTIARAVHAPTSRNTKRCN